MEHHVSKQQPLKNNKTMSNYPAGAEHDPRAPYNQSEPEEEVRDVEFSCILRKTAEVGTTNYIGGGTYPEWDGDRYVAATENPDFSNTDWVEEWKNCESTPLFLIEKLKEISLALAEGKMPERPKNSRKSYWKELAKSCEGWEEEDAECEMI